MIRRLLIGTLLLLSIAFPAGADSSHILLHPGEILSGTFVQKLQRAGFTNVLQSDGSFVLALDQGLVWQTNKPVNSTIVITRAAFVQLANGKEVQHVPASKAPILDEVYSWLASSLSGDRSKLAQMFSIEEQDNDPEWRLLLRPLPANQMLATQIQSVTITGDRFIDNVVIQRSNGDVQTTVFSDHALSSGPLPPDAAALLSQASQ